MKSYRLAFYLSLLTFALWSGLGFVSRAESIAGPEIRLIFTVTIKDLTSGEIYDGNDNTEVYFLQPWHTYEVIYTCYNPTPESSAYDVYANLALPTEINNRGTSYITGTLRATNTQPGIVFNQAAVSSEVALYTVLSEDSCGKGAIDALTTDEGYYVDTLSNYDDDYYSHGPDTYQLSYIFRAIPKWSLNRTTLLCWLKYKPVVTALSIIFLVIAISIIMWLHKGRVEVRYRRKIERLEEQNAKLERLIEGLTKSKTVEPSQPFMYNLKTDAKPIETPAENPDETPLNSQESDTND